MTPESQNPVARNVGLPAIEATGVCRRFGEVTALQDVSLQIFRGEFFSLLGPSGCGKTTLLRMIAGLDVPDSGAFYLHGQTMAGVPAHKRPVNTVFQSYALFPHMTIRDNVGFGLRMSRTPKNALDERVEKVMNLVRISELGNRMPAEISGGQKQRVALARAIVNEPSVLLLDEPLGALDLQLRKELQTELRQLQKRLGITFVHVTHDQDEALAMSDRIAVMKAGRIEQLGTAAELYERPRTPFVARFLGSCNLLEGSWSAGTLTLPFGQVNLALDTPPTRANITVAIRPEKIIVQGTPPAAEGLSFQARVQDVVYRGSEIQCSLRCGETLLTAVLMNTHARPELRLDSLVWCWLPSPALVPLED